MKDWLENSLEKWGSNLGLLVNNSGKSESSWGKLDCN